MNTLKNAHVLVTGGTGFTGSHLVEALVKAKSRVVVPYRHFPSLSYLQTEGLVNTITAVPCDIKDFEAVMNLITTHTPDYIVHFAAQGSIPPDPNSYLELMESNVMGTANLLDAARRYGKCRGFIMVSSDKAYGKKNTAYTEQDPIGGNHPYEVSKAAGDLLARSYLATFKLSVIVVRAGNIYGPGDLHTERIVPTILKSVLAHTPIHLRSDGTFVRDYIYVDDVISAYIYLLSHFSEHIGEIFHVSSDKAYSVLELIETAKRVFATDIPYTVVNNAVNEIPYQHLLSDKMHALGWKPIVSIEEGLQKTFTWYSAHKELLGL